MSEASVAMRKQSEADELKSLADKFLASQGVAVKKVDVLPPSINVLIGVPCFGGSIQHQTVNLLMSLSSSLSNAKIPHQTHFVAGESLIMRARNYLASVAAFSHDNAGRPFSHLMFIDADISFHPEYFLKMLKANLPIVALPYSQKKLDWKCIAEAAKRVPPESLPFFAGNPVIVADSGFATDDKPIPVRASGTGAMLNFRSGWAAANASKTSTLNRPRLSHSSQSDWNYDFFRAKILDEEFLGEDHGFCEESARLGFSTFLLPMAVTRHTGSYDYVMDMSAVASADAALKSNESVEQPTK
jgi:hypothetical protein